MILILMLACQVVPTPPALRSTSTPIEVKQSATPGLPTSTTTGTAVSNPTAPSPSTPSPGGLAEFSYRGDLPFAAIEHTNQVKDPLTKSWPIDLPVSLAEIRNIKVADGLSLRQRDLLAQQGFLIIRSHEPQFSEIRRHVSWAYGQPYLLTADAASHALKVSLDQLLKALEREELHRRLRMLTETTLHKVQSFFPLLAGSELEDDARLAAAYLGVGLRLLDPAASLDPELEAMITPQVEQILAGRGREDAALFPGLSENFLLYRPEGHYRGDSSLEAYFRGKTWFERIYFPMGEAGSGSGTEFVPLILTLALRQSTTEMGHSTQEYTRIVETLNFFEGVRYGGGPPETAILMDRAYGVGATILGLQDQPQLDIFRSLVRDLPLPQTDPVLVLEPSGEDREKSWSLLGMHYSIHSLAMQRFAQELPPDADSTFLLPGGLELMGVLGSDLAMKARLQEGAEVRIDPEIVANLSQIILNQPEADWEASMGNLWLDGFRDRLRISEAKHADFVFPGETAGLWAEKELNSILGSWADMQSESAELSFLAEEGGGGELEEIDPRSSPLPRIC